MGLSRVVINTQDPELSELFSNDRRLFKSRALVSRQDCPRMGVNDCLSCILTARSERKDKPEVQITKARLYRRRSKSAIRQSTI